MNFTVKDPDSSYIAERIVDCMNRAFEDFHLLAQDKWLALAPARPHIMHALLVDEMRQEFVDDNFVQHQSNDQLKTFLLPDKKVQVRVKKQIQGAKMVSSNDTSRDKIWGLSLRQGSLTLEGIESVERLILAYKVARDWQSISSLSFMEFKNRKCVALEYLPLIPAVTDPIEAVDDSLERFHPPLFEINMDGWDRQEQPEVEYEEFEEEDETGS